MKYSIIISDASPLAIFSKIGAIEILKETFDSISITKEVQQEFEAKGNIIPEWIGIKSFRNRQKSEELQKDLDVE